MLRSVIFAAKPEYYWISLLLFLGIVLIAILCWKRLDFESIHEGFQQEKPYMYINNVYLDPVYISMYDRLMLPQDILDNVTTEMIEMTQPSISHSTLLDVGSGTGTVAATLARRGYTVYGVDQSPIMIHHAMSRYSDIPTLQLKQANFLVRMLWESGSFTHIMCTGYTFFLQCAIWSIQYPV